MKPENMIVVSLVSLYSLLLPAAETAVDVDGGSLFSEMLSMKTSIEDADKMFAEVFAGHREDRLLEASVILREDGKPAIELDPHAGKATVSVQLAVDKKAWIDWVSDAQNRFGEMSERVEPMDPVHYLKERRDDVWDGSELFVVNRLFVFKKDFAPTIKKRISDIPRRLCIRVALADKAGLTIAASFAETRDFSTSPLGFYHFFRQRDFVDYGEFPVFCTGKPGTCDISFKGLSLADLQKTAKVVCRIGTYGDLVTTGTDNALSYRKTHPNRTTTIRGVSFELAPLSPRLLIGTTEVTQALWETVMGENPSQSKEPDKPVENVSWHECQSFIEKLNALPETKTEGFVFRLPRVEEWEFACRAGATDDQYCKLADGTVITKDTLDRVAWFNDNSHYKTHPVGKKDPNAFGLYDMHGNVSEWTLNMRGESRVTCGGSSWSSYRGCKPPSCESILPYDRDGGRGVRICAEAVTAKSDETDNKSQSPSAARKPGSEDQY